MIESHMRRWTQRQLTNKLSRPIICRVYVKKKNREGQNVNIYMAESERRETRK